MNENYATLKRIVEENIGEFIESLPDNNLGRAIGYALSGGGKRLRPIMLLAGSIIANGDIIESLPYAIAVELIHNYSLIHDDMPCMDNDDIRRGLPTVHKKFGEWTALLAGDALLNAAYEILINYSDNTDKINASKIIASAAGTHGMIYGQYLDLSHDGTSDKNLLTVSRYKTGALFCGALTAGATLYGADKKILDALYCFGENFGLAFQIKDDLDDFSRTPYSDKNLKFNYAFEVGESEANRQIINYINKAKKSIISLENNEILMEILSFL